MVVPQEKPDYSHVEQPRVSPKRRVRSQPLARQEKGYRIILTLMVFCAFIMGAAVNYCHAQAVNVGYRLGELESKINKVEKENQSLEVALGRLDSLDRVAVVARSKMGMVEPDQNDVFYIAMSDVSPEDAAGNGNSTASTNRLTGEKVISQAGQDESRQGMLESFLNLVCRWGQRASG